jgi:hypothetical protein
MLLGRSGFGVLFPYKFFPVNLFAQSWYIFVRGHVGKWNQVELESHEKDG